MSNFNLASLPPSMLHKILSKVATNHLRDFGSARIVFPGLSATNPVIHRPSTCEVCMSSSSSIYLMKEGKKSVLLVRDGMLNLAFSVDDRGLVHNYPSFGRECVDRMDRMIATSNYLIVSYHCWCSEIMELVFLATCSLGLLQ
ncbi:unnamed protein product [Brassica oleracea]